LKSGDFGSLFSQNIPLYGVGSGFGVFFFFWWPSGENLPPQKNNNNKIDN
jgi:hypothetical protein